MKNNFFLNNAVLKTILISFIIFEISISQSNSSFFPHSEGDTWVYEVLTWDGSYYYQYKKQVIFDSTDQNGNTFVIMHVNYPTSDGNLYYMIDSTGDVYHTNSDFQPYYLRYKTAGNKGDKWAVRDISPNDFAQIYEIYNDVLFSEECQIKVILFYTADSLNDTTNIFDLYVDRLADKFGFIRRGGGETFEDTYLQGAVIDGILYGDTTIISDISENLNIQNNPDTDLLITKQYPNPFNSITIFNFDVLEPTNLNLIIYDIYGREVIKLIENEKFSRGSYSSQWNGLNSNRISVSSGVYFYLFFSNQTARHGKLCLIR